MKKFGTPTRAAPGVASEKLGFVGAGVPFEFVSFGAGTNVGLCVFSPAAWHSLAEVESEPVTTRSPHLTTEPVPECAFAFLRFFFGAGVAVAVGVAVPVAVAVGSAFAVAVGVAVATVVFTGEGAGLGVAVSVAAAVGAAVGACVGAEVGAGDEIGVAVAAASSTVGSGDGACAGAAVPSTAAYIAAAARPAVRMRRITSCTRTRAGRRGGWPSREEGR